MRRLLFCGGSLLLVGVLLMCVKHRPIKKNLPLETVVELNVGESRAVQLVNSTPVQVKLEAVHETCDPLRGAVRRAEVRAVINGQTVTLIAGTYHLPVAVGELLVDCPVTAGYLQKARGNDWGLDRAARLRIWSARRWWRAAHSFVYPVRQRFLAFATQLGNEPVFVDGGEDPRQKSVYYHFGQDLGGAEGLDEVVSATDAVVVALGGQVLPEYAKDTPVEPHPDVVFTVDANGVFYRYEHLNAIDSMLQLGDKIAQGRRIGLLGKEGCSGGWAHLHFQMISRQPSGKWGTQDAFPFLLQGYCEEHGLTLKALARPHQFCGVGQPVLLDGSVSWSRTGIKSYQWTLDNGKQLEGVQVARTYREPGQYCEMLTVTDKAGHTDRDFATILVVDPARDSLLPPALHLVHHPSLGVKAGQPVAVLVRSFTTTLPDVTLSFGDNTPDTVVRSDGNADMMARDGYTRVPHIFARPGEYIVTAATTNQYGFNATQKMVVQVK